MPIYQCNFRNRDGKLISDTKEAPDREVLLQELRRNQFFPISVTEVSATPNTRPLRRGFRPKDRELVIFTRQLSNLLDSGVVLSRALNFLVNQTRNHQFEATIASIRDDVVTGGPFWEALARYPQSFSRLYVSMVKAGESGASLEKVMRNLADYTEMKGATRAAIISLLIYPAILLVVGTGSLIFLLTFVVPKMFFIFRDLGQDLPLTTRILVGVSHFLSGYFWLLALLAGAAVYLFLRFYSREPARLKVDRWLLTVPGVGETLQKMSLARFAQILGLVLANGVSILEGLDMARDVVSNRYLRQGLVAVNDSVAQGGSLSASLAKAQVFPPLIVNMVSVGEETGKMEEMLLKVSQLYEREVQEDLKRFVSLLEPALILLLAFGVGFIVMAMLLPVFQMNLDIL